MNVKKKKLTFLLGFVMLLCVLLQPCSSRMFAEELQESLLVESAVPSAPEEENPTAALSGGDGVEVNQSEPIRDQSAVLELCSESTESEADVPDGDQSALPMEARSMPALAPTGQPAVLAPEAVQATIAESLEDPEDLFNSLNVVDFKEQCFKIHIAYDVLDKGLIESGTRLTVELKPEEGAQNYLKYPYTFTKNTSVKADSGDTLADLKISDGALKADLTFKDIDKNFKIDINSSIEVMSARLFKYFEDHPQETSLEATYYLYINGVKQDKKITFNIPKPKPVDVETKFVKTTGSYTKGDRLGEGQMFYNIKVGTKLRKANEFFIYDTPDVNLAFEDQTFRALFTTGKGEFYGDPFYRSSDGPSKLGEGDPETRMETHLYDIYYLTAEPTKPSLPRQATYENQKLHLDRYNVITGKTGFESMDDAAVPQNILLEKPFGAELTEAEQKKIDEAGGLNKTVGKGFKIRIKNFNHPLYEEGGSFTLVFNMKIVHPSTSLNDKGNPVYYNTASYYAQEIPTCDPEKDDKCTPIKSEKTKLEDIIKGKYTSEAVLEEGQIGASVDEYTLVSFTKQDSKGQALAGATFTIYQSDAEGKKSAVAKNKEGIELRGLISNQEGQLSLPGADGQLKPVTLRLKRGYYLIIEDQAPEGYKKAPDCFFTVGLAVDPIVIKNQAETTASTTGSSTETTTSTESTTGKSTATTASTRPTTSSQVGDLTGPSSASKSTESTGHQASEPVCRSSKADGTGARLARAGENRISFGGLTLLALAAGVSLLLKYRKQEF